MKSNYKLIFILLLAAISFSSLSANNKLANTKFVDNKISVSEDEYNKLLKENYELKKILYETDYFKKTEVSHNALINEFKKETKEEIGDYKKIIIDRMNLYIIFISVVVAFIAFIINFFGRQAIKTRVEELIKETAGKYAEDKADEVINNKVTDNYVAQIIHSKGEFEVLKLLSSLEEKGKKVIERIQKDGERIINSVSASPEVFNQNDDGIVNNNIEENIENKKNTIRTIEKFNIAFNTKDPKIKIDLYNTVIEQEPNNWRALNNIGAAYNELPDYKKAINYLTKGINLNSKFGLLYANRANSYNQLNMLEEAYDDVEKAILLDAENELAYTVKGNILTKRKQYKDAEIALSKAIEINPISSHAYFNRAFFNEETGNYDSSYSDYMKAEELGYPILEILYNNLAVLHRRTNDTDEAFKYLDKAKLINPNWSNIYGTQALIYADMNDDENFYKYLKIALDKGCPVWNYLSDPGFDNYRDSKKLIELINSYKERLK